MSLKFKGSGTNVSHRKFTPTKDEVESRLTPIGIKTPLDFGDGNNEFLKCHTSPIEQIKDNLKNLILTNRGERLGRFNFGCDFQSLLMESTSLGETIQVEFLKTLNEQIAQQMPIVSIQDVNFQRPAKDESQAAQGLSLITVFIKFSIPKLRQNDLGIKVNMLMGG